MTQQPLAYPGGQRPEAMLTQTF